MCTICRGEGGCSHFWNWIRRNTSRCNTYTHFYMQCMVDFRHARAFSAGNLWFVWAIDCNIKHCILQSINFHYTEYSNYLKSEVEFPCNCTTPGPVVWHISVLALVLIMETFRYFKLVEPSVKEGHPSINRRGGEGEAAPELEHWGGGGGGGGNFRLQYTGVPRSPLSYLFCNSVYWLEPYNNLNSRPPNLVLLPPP